MSYRQAFRVIGEKWRNIFQWSAVLVPPLIAVNDNLVSLQMVAGRSMSPTFNPEDSHWLDVVLVSKVSDFQAGDVVLLADPVREDRTRIVKRVAAISNDGSSVFVLGDNGPHSTDSRQFGAVPSVLVEGVVQAIVFPPWRFSSSLSRASLTA